MATVLYVLADTIRQLAILSQPFMPDASAKLLDQLGVLLTLLDFIFDGFPYATGGVRERFA